MVLLTVQTEKQVDPSVRSTIECIKKALETGKRKWNVNYFNTTDKFKAGYS